MHSTADKRLFWASFLTLIAAGIGFSIRGAILGDWSKQFGFTQGELGNITGGGLVGFGITIIALSFFADRVGYGPLMILAFLLHTASAVVTLAATPIFDAYGKEATFQCLYWGMFLFALGNGTCEAVINPLTATLYPENKTHWLNILHAGWPGGLILGAVMGLIFEATKTRWEIQMGVFLVPTLMYGLLMLGQPFPRSEAKSAGITLEGMMQELGLLGAGVASLLLGLWLTQSAADLRLPSFLGWVVAAVLLLIFGYFSSFRLGHWMLAFLLVLHAMVGYVELGTDSWITNITGTILENKTYGLLLFIWTSGLMFALRFFAGPIVHQISPLGLLFGSAVLGTIGLLMLGYVSGAALLIVAATIYGLGKTFYWPTMLGVVSERFPRGGALTLGTIGGVGMLSAGLLGGPGIGYKQDYAASHDLQDKAPQTYQRYKSENENRFLFFPPIAGLDGSKVATLNSDGAQLQADIAALEKSGRQLSDDKNLEKLNAWWQSAKAYEAQDKPAIKAATLHGGRQALIWTAAVPAVMALGYLFLILYFRTQGGYQQVHIGGDVHEKKTLASEYLAGGDKHPGGLGSEAIQAPGGIKPAP
jgi:MFS family permease